MDNLLGNVIPILFLIAFGYVLRRVNYFEEAAIHRLTHMVANILVPCVIFTTLLNLDIRAEHLLLTVGFALYQVILLLLSFLVYKAFHIKRRFFPFYSCAFAFGFMALPLFSTVFGEAHMDELIAMGVGQELFVALIFITTAKLYLKREKTDAPQIKQLLKSLCSPLFIMILFAVMIKLTGWQPRMEGSAVFRGLFSAIGKLGAMTSVLTMIIVGYRLSFRSLERVRESFLYVAFRYALTFLVGYAFKYLVLDRFASGAYYDYAFFTLLSQHGSVLLTVYVAEYCGREDLEVASNAFVINALVGILLYVVFVFRLGLG